MGQEQVEGLGDLLDHRPCPDHVGQGYADLLRPVKHVRGPAGTQRGPRHDRCQEDNEEERRQVR